MFAITSILVWLIIGLIAGFLATRVIKGPHFGIIGDIVIGLVGAFIGGLIADVLFPASSFHFIGTLILAVIGAIILLVIIRFIAKAMGRPVARSR